jgi:hypothetical protein
MEKLDLTSIQNHAKKQVAVKQVKQDKQVEPRLNDVPSFSSIIKSAQVRKEVEKPIHPVKVKPKEEEKEEMQLTENQRDKLIALLNMYIAEFPEKLGKYKGKNFHKMKDNELIEYTMFHKEVSTSNNLNMAIDATGKLLPCNFFFTSSRSNWNFSLILSTALFPCKCPAKQFWISVVRSLIAL